MGWLSDTWSSAKDAVSSAWDSTKDAITDVTGVESLNTLLATGGLAMVPANLSGQGILGEALYDTMGPMMGMNQQPGMMGQPQMTGPLMGAAPASLTMGSGGGGSVGQSSPQDLASLFGESGYQYGPSQTSAALLQSNPEAYKYSPLTNGFS